MVHVFVVSAKNLLLVGTWELRHGQGLGLWPELDNCRVTDAPCWSLSSPHCHQSGQKISQWRKLDTMSSALRAEKHHQALSQSQEIRLTMQQL